MMMLMEVLCLELIISVKVLVVINIIFVLLVFVQCKRMFVSKNKLMSSFKFITIERLYYFFLFIINNNCITHFNIFLNIKVQEVVMVVMMMKIMTQLNHVIHQLVLIVSIINSTIKIYVKISKKKKKGK